MHSGRARHLAFVWLIVAFSVSVGAESLEQFDRRIEAELRAKDPEACALFQQANAARARGDHAAAITLYRRVHEKQLTFTHATRRLATELLTTGQAAEGIALLREAVAIDPSPLNQSVLAMALVVPQPGRPPSDADSKTASGICAALVHNASDDLSVQQLCTQVAFATGAFEAGVAGAANLERLAPDELHTASYAAVAHAVQGEFLRAELDLWRARQRGLPDADYTQLRHSIHAGWPWWLVAAVWAGVGVVVWLVLAACLLAAGVVLSRATLARAHTVADTVNDGDDRSGGALRRLYAVVIGVAGSAYFLSLPLLLVVVVLTGGGLILGMLSVGHVPVKIILVVGVTLLATVWSILKSLVVIGKDTEPGVRTDMDVLPRLREVLAEVAGAIGTRPVDSVYLLPGTEFAVMERGGLRQRLQGHAERCLLVGVGVLDGFKLAPFKAVLAHEYGHFVNKDTAGGRFSLAVRRSIYRMATGLASSGAASLLNPAWLFLQASGRLFERISQGSSRLQEVMADRWAVGAYGARPFIDGLTHVIDRSVRFNAHVTATFSEFDGRQDELVDLYAHRPAALPSETEIREEVERIVTAPPSPYDSHPSPSQRFAWAAQMSGVAGAAGAGGEEVWGLFGNRRAIEAAMSRRILGRE